MRKVCPVKWHEKIPNDGISLGVADVDFHGPEGVVDHIKDHLVEEFSFYQHQRGLPDAVQAASDYLQNKGVMNTDGRIQIIEGTMMGISIAMQWISQKPGDLLVLGPIYEPIHRHASRNGNVLHWSPINDQGIDEEHIKKMVADNQLKMITICNPTNPIGHVFREEELKFLGDICADNDLVLFSDELYEPLTFNRGQITAASVPQLKDRSIMLYGFSKAYGLAGYRSGFMYLGMELEELQYIAAQHMVSPSPIASIVCDFALTDENSKSWVRDLRDQCHKTTKFASKLFNQLGYDTNTPDGCFFVFPDIGVNDVAFSEFLLEKYGTQVVPGSAFGPDGAQHLRINCATSVSRLERGIDTIDRALKQFDR